MCWLMNTCRPTLRATVFLRCAPTARMTGSSRGTRHRQGREAARPAQQPHPARRDPGHAVVHVPLDGAVVHQEEVGDAAEPLQGPVLVRADGLVGQVAAGRHDREAAARAAAGGAAAWTAASRRGTGCPAPPPRRPARPPAAAAAGSAPRPRRGARPRGPSTSHSSRAWSRSRTIRANGLPSRSLRSRRRATAALVARVAHEVEAAQALDRDDAALAPAPARRPASAASPRGQRRARGVPQRDDRPAGRAGDGLGVEAAVARVLVLGAGRPGRGRSRASSCWAGRRAARAGW